MRHAILLASFLATLAATGARASEPPAARAYEQARRVFFALKASPTRQRFRHHWLRAITTFESVASTYPDTPQAPRARYTAAELWAGLYDVSRRDADLDQALTAYARVAREFPGSTLADDALWNVAQLELRVRRDEAAAARAVQRMLARYPQGDCAPRARALWPRVAGALARRPADDEDDEDGPLVGRRENGGEVRRVTALKHWASDSYSRVVLYLSGPAEARDLGQRGAGAAPRLVIDLAGSALAPGLETDADLQDRLLSRARLEPHGKASVRLTLELKRPAQHRLIALENPYRIVVDAFTSDAPPPTSISARGRVVVVDPGHGGHDAGATSRGGLAEKDVTLAIAKDLEAILVERGVEVVLTRTDDSYVGLEERTAIANRAAGDVFVSIHANAHRGRQARGVQTYYLDTTDDRYALRLAAIENATQEEQVSEVQLALADLATRLNSRDSRALAQEVQKALLAALRTRSPGVRDLGARPSLFYVLLGARMPAVLVETSFLSNPEEARLLGQATYRHAAAQGIARALLARFAEPIVASRP